MQKVKMEYSSGHIHAEAVVMGMAVEQHNAMEEERRHATARDQMIEARAAELERAADEITDTRFSRWLRERARAVRMSAGRTV